MIGVTSDGGRRHWCPPYRCLNLSFSALTLSRRVARPADYEFARKAHHAAYRDVAERQFGPWDEVRQDQFFARDWQGATFEVLEWDGVPCGYTAIEERENDVHVRELVIHPDFQRLGIGSTVLREAMRTAEDRSVPVHLGTFVLNHARRLYERMGFVEVGRDKTHVTLRWTRDRVS